MYFTKSTRSCINDPTEKCRSNQHFMKYFKDSIKEYFEMNTNDFVDLWRHHSKFVEQKCGAVCSKDEPCKIHKRLFELTDFVEYNRDFNLNTKNEIISKIALFFEKDSTRRGAFWWYTIDIWDFKDVPENTTLRWRAQFV